MKIMRPPVPVGEAEVRNETVSGRVEFRGCKFVKGREMRERDTHESCHQICVWQLTEGDGVPLL